MDSIPADTGHKLNVHNTFTDVQDVFWSSYPRSIYVLCLWELLSPLLLFLLGGSAIITTCNYIQKKKKSVASFQSWKFKVHQLIAFKNVFSNKKTRYKLFWYTSTQSNSGQRISLWLVSIGTTSIVIKTTKLKIMEWQADKRWLYEWYNDYKNFGLIETKTIVNYLSIALMLLISLKIIQHFYIYRAYFVKQFSSSARIH